MASILTFLAIVPLFAASQSPSPGWLRREANNPADPPALAAKVRSWFGKEIQSWADAKVADLEVAWALDDPNASSVAIRTNYGGVFPLKQIGKTGVFVASEKLGEGSGFVWQFVVDGKERGPKRNLEVYSPDPDSMPKPGVPQGKIEVQPKWKSQIYAGTEREWWIYVPAQYRPEEPACLMVFNDGVWAKNYAQPYLDNLIARKEMPATIGVFISPGVFADGKSNRSVEYDTLSDKFSRFLLDEMIPEVQKRYRLREGPENWAITGLSSGGICAFTAAWERPDKFGKVLSWIGSFTNIAGGESGISGGHNYPALIRRNPMKPIRVFLQDGANDLDNPYGNWWLSNLSMDAALRFKGYDCKFVGGNGFHSDKHGRAIFGDALRWLWRGVKT